MKILGSKESVKMSFSTQKHNMHNKRQLGNSCWGGGSVLKDKRFIHNTRHTCYTSKALNHSGYKRACCFMEIPRQQLRQVV